jgi:adenosyl cobinamide kinase/adenosyl cobinamide phosphate guanylyltransferase
VIRLVLGGARSGKSEVAEQLAQRSGRPVAYVATATLGGDDPEWAARIAAHRARRPPWPTTEVPAGGDLATSVAQAAAAVTAAPASSPTVLIDSLGVWLAGLDNFTCDAASVAGALDAVAADIIVVSEEVGMGVHPATEAGRAFRDSLGSLNRAIADVAGEVMLVVAGRALPLDRLR